MRAARGNNLPHAKLNPFRVKAIRERHAYGVPIPRMAEQYGVHVRTIEKVISYESWYWVR